MLPHNQRRAHTALGEVIAALGQFGSLRYLHISPGHVLYLPSVPKSGDLSLPRPQFKCANLGIFHVM